jgi:hypothetical protein
MAEAATKSWNRYVLHLILGLLVVTLGAIEGWYQRTFYTTDAISYLSVSRAISNHEWKFAFNALWSSGYPFLIAIVRPLFPSTAQGEWLAIHVLNLLILIFTYLSFLYLLKGFSPDLAEHANGDPGAQETFLLLAGFCIFVCAELCLNGASRVSPDPLVDGLFFAALGTLIRLIRKPTVFLAALLGVILGIGYLVKAIFLPLSVIILLVTALALRRTTGKIKLSAIALAVFLVFSIPYVVGLSWSFGRFTTGETGSLNYAFHVNLLPRWTNWEGGPQGYGMPIHPTRLLMKNPDLFEFASPFHDTYPPFGHIAYWYEGYRHFWSPKYQAIGIVRNLYYLALLLVKQPITYAILGIILVLLLAFPFKDSWVARTYAYWPFFVPPLMAIGLYVWVHLEDRYLAGFLATLGALPFVSLCASQSQLPRRLRLGVIATLALATLASLATKDATAFRRAIHHQPYTIDPQWKLAAALQQVGLKPGDNVAAIGGTHAECTWAYADGLRIVAELGGGPYDPHPLGGHEHWWSNRKDPPPDTSTQTFWNSPPEQQAKILNLFRKAGAVVVIVGSKPSAVRAPGWRKVSGTESWIYQF